MGSMGFADRSSLSWTKYFECVDTRLSDCASLCLVDRRVPQCGVSA